MLDFEYYGPTRILFGKEAMQSLPEQLKKLGATMVLLVHSGGKGSKAAVDDARTLLKGAGIRFAEFDGVKPNPRLSRALEGVEFCKQVKADFVLAVGGGSVIDTAKAIAAGVLLPEGEELWRDYYYPKNRFKASLPVGVVLTIPAAGSEASFGTVITHDTLHMKRYTGGEPLIPKFAVLNPVYSETLPLFQTASGAFDILAHLIERYCVNFKNVELSDRMIEACIRTVLNNAVILVDNPTDYAARAEIMWAGCIAHNKILEMGRTHGDWSSHDIAHELSSLYDMSHGASLAIIMPAWIKYVYKHNLPKFLQLARRAFDVDCDETRSDEAVAELVRRLENFWRVMQLPTHLHEVGIDDRDFRQMARSAMEGRAQVGTGNGIVRLGEEDVVNIFRLAL